MYTVIKINKVINSDISKQCHIFDGAAHTIKRGSKIVNT